MNIENRELSQKLVDTIDFLKQSISKISVYDLNYYSMAELYYGIAKKMNELIEMYHEFGVSISEEIIKQNECLQYLLNDGLNKEVVNKINQMVADGTMDTIINTNLFNELNSQIKEIDTQTQKIVNNDIKFKENFLLKRNPYGTYENASSFSVVTNSDNKVQVLGISPKNDKTLATYDNRDIVGIYNSVSTNKDNIFVFENCNFTQYTVTIPSNYNLENIKEGMIIDTSHSPKFSAIIREINKDTNVITVYNWYQMGNESLGQIPTGGATIKINNVTKIWNINTNLFLNEGDYNTAGCGFEMDIINHQPHVDNVDGFDLVLTGSYGGNNGYTARGKGGLKWLKGFVSKLCDTGFYTEDSSVGFRSLGSKLYAFLSNNSDVSFCSKGTKSQKALQSEVDGKVFTIKNDGSMSALGLDYVVGNSNIVVNPYNSPVCIMTGNIKLVPPSECGKKYFIAHNVATTSSSITATMKKGTQSITGLFLETGKSVHMYCDGSIYYVLDFNL